MRIKRVIFLIKINDYIQTFFVYYQIIKRLTHQIILKFQKN